MVQTLKKSFTIQVTCRTPKRKAEDTKHKAWVEAKKHRYMTAPGLSAVDVLIFGRNYNNRRPEMGKRKEKYFSVPSFKIQLWKFVRYLPCDTSTLQWCLYMQRQQKKHQELPADARCRCQNSDRRTRISARSPLMPIIIPTKADATVFWHCYYISGRGHRVIIDDGTLIVAGDFYAPICIRRESAGGVKYLELHAIRGDGKAAKVRDG